LITPAAIIDNFRTLDYGYDINDFHNAFTQSIDNHTPYGIKPFFTTRRNMTLSQLPLGTGVTDTYPLKFTVYPNPVLDKIFVSAPLGIDWEWVILNMEGQTVRSGKWQSGFATYISEAEGLTPGIYCIEIRDKAGMRAHELFWKQ
jgi:hypothetical protein